MFARCWKVMLEGEFQIFGGNICIKKDGNASSKDGLLNMVFCKESTKCNLRFNKFFKS